MTGLFLIVCIYGLIIKFNYIDDVLMLIIKDAFTIKSGFISIVILGLKRSLFSNEAGLGTAPSINSYSDNTPIKQGYLQVLTCFIDTIIMCVLLGIVILLFNVNMNNINSEQLSITIFENIFPNYGKLIGNIILFTFSLATIISGYYAGESNMLFNCINKKDKIEKYKFVYKLLFIIGLFIGVFFTNNKLWNLVDYGLILLGVVNIFVIIKLQVKFKENINEN
jgi:AGCS family alanine or glycine:cation symporter